MPYLADGSYTTDLGPSTPAAGGDPPEPGVSYGNGPKQQDVLRMAIQMLGRGQKTQKPTYEPPKIPTFQEYAPHLAANLKIPSLATATDDQLMELGRNYARAVAPLASKNGKVDDVYLNAAAENYARQVRSQLPQLREYFKNLEPTTPAAPPTTGPYFGDYAKSLGGKAVSGTGEAISDLAKQISLPNNLADFVQYGAAGALAGPLQDMLREKLGIPKEDALQHAINQGAQAVNPLIQQITKPVSDFGGGIAKTGENLEQSTSPEYKNLAQGDLYNPDGSINFASLGPKINENVLGMFAKYAGPALATILTKNPGPMMLGGAGIGAAEARSNELNRFNALTPEELSRVPSYQAKLQEGKTPEVAKQESAKEASEVAAKIALIPGGVMGAAAEITPLFKPVAGNLLTRFVKNYAKQGPAFAALAAAQQVLPQAAANVMTGENRDVLKGVGETAAIGALGALPFAPFGKKLPGKGKVAATITPETAAIEGKITPEAQAAGVKVANTPSADGEIGQSIIQALAEKPVPSKEFLVKNPKLASEAYNEALDVFTGDLQGNDIPPAQIAEAIPKFKAEWVKRSGGVDPTITPGVEQTPTITSGKPEEVSATPEATPEELTAAADIAGALPPELPGVPTEGVPQLIDRIGEQRQVPRETSPQLAEDIGEQPPVPTDLPPSFEAPELRGSDIHALTAADHIPEGIRERVREDLKYSEGRDPTPREIAKESEQLLKLVLDDPRIDRLLPEKALHEAVGELISRNVGEEFPDAVAINRAAREIAKRPVKTEAIPKENVLRQKERPVNKVVEKENILAKKELAGEQVSEPAYSAIQDVSYKPTGRSVENIRGALEKRLGKRAVKALEESKILKFVQSKTELPFEKAQNYPGGISGVYHDGTVHLVADHITPGAEFRTLVHEVGVHYGMKRILGKDLYGEVERYLQDAIHENTAAGAELKAAQEAVARSGTPLDQVNEETIAYMVQSKLAQTPGTLWNRVVNAIKAFLYEKIGKYLKPEDARKLLSNDVITQIAKSAVKQAARLRNQEENFRFADGRFEEGQEPYYMRQEEKAPQTYEDLHASNKIKSHQEAEADLVASGKPSRAEKAGTYYFNQLNPLRYLNESLAKKGIKVGPAENMFDEASRYQLTGKRAGDLAGYEVVDPFLNKVAELSIKTGKKADEYLNYLTDYFMGRGAVERNEFGELTKGALTKEGEIARDKIKQQWVKGELGRDEYVQKLRDLMMQPDIKVEGRKPINDSGITNVLAYEAIAKARKRGGITDQDVNELLPYYRKIVEFINKNYAESKRFSESDTARREAMGWKWYLPFRDLKETNVSYDGRSPGAFTREYQAAKGRTDIASNPIFSLLKEAVRSAIDVPQNEFTKSIYKFARKHGEEFGIKLETINTEKEMRDAVANGKNISDITRIKKDENTVIHNGGEYKYVIRFPEKMASVVNAIKSIDAAQKELNPFLRASGKVSNFISRGATVYNVAFQTVTGPVRDVLWNGSQIAADLGYKAAGRYVKDWLMAGGPYGTLGTYFKGMKGRNLLERQKYALESGSEIAKTLETMAKYGGDLSFDQMLNATRSMGNLYEALEKATKPSTSLSDKLNAITHSIDTWGTAAFMSSRITAFRTYVRTATERLGHEPSAAERIQIDKDAALFSRRLTDYMQRSDFGRSLNTLIPFSRVLITASDRILASFRKADGSYDVKKIVQYSGMGLAASMMNYELMRAINPEIDKMSDGDLASNFFIPLGKDGGFIKVPMAYGLMRMFLIPGMMINRAARGVTSKEDAANVIFHTYAEALSPFYPPDAEHNANFSSLAYDMLEAFAPTVLRAPIDIGRNKSTFGGTITPNPEFTDKQGPRSEHGFTNTPAFWKEAAQWMRTLSGHAIDVYPESLRYMVQSYGTGPGTAFIRSMSLLDAEMNDKEIGIGQIPFAANVYTSGNQFYESNKIGELRKDLAGYPKDSPQTRVLKQIESMQKRFGDRQKSIDKSTESSEYKRTRRDELRKEQKEAQKRLIEEAERIQ